jgi:hypothetical protein
MTKRIKIADRSERGCAAAAVAKPQCRVRKAHAGDLESIEPTHV